MANEEFDTEKAQSEFSGYLEELQNKIMRGLEKDLVTFRRYRPEDNREEISFKQQLRDHLKNSRLEIDNLINDIEQSLR